MVRFSVTMDDSLTDTIDTSCAKKKISRSDWISEACTTHIAKSNGTSVIGATTLPSAGPVMGPEDHNMPDYEEMYRNFRIEVPEYFNFGFDVIDA
jgi:acetyl-CoA synthetase